MSPAKTLQSADRWAKTVDSLMPRLKSELADLVRIPSISEAGFSPDPVHDAHTFVAELLRDAGVKNVGQLDLPNTFPIITGEIPAPAGAPTVLLYGHYDVVPAGDESKWQSPPFEPTERNGALYGRGSSDSKANVMAHVGALRAYGGKPPVGIKVVIEGQEEVGSAFNTYPPLDPARFRCDAMVIADMGSVRPGVPTLTVALRGTAVVTVEVKTLAGPKHSGQYGGAAPDALLVLLRAIASLHDDKGNVVVPGLRREEWTGASYSEDEFRELAELQPGMPFIGTGEPRGAAVVWSGDHRDRLGRAAGRQGGERRRAVCACEDQPPRPSGAGRRRGTPVTHRLSQETSAVRHPARRQARSNRQWLRGQDVRARLRCGPNGAGLRVGREDRQRCHRWLDPARQRAAHRRAGCRDPAAWGRRTASAIFTLRTSVFFSMSSGRR